MKALGRRAQWARPGVGGNGKDILILPWFPSTCGLQGL